MDRTRIDRECKQNEGKNRRHPNVNLVKFISTDQLPFPALEPLLNLPLCRLAIVRLS